MPDVHVDSMIFQYPFFCSFFSLCFLVFLQSLCVWQFVQGQLHFWFFDLFVFFPRKLELVFKPYQPVKVLKKTKKKTENNQSLFSVVMNLLCFDYDKCWCCLDCFGLFLCTEWILFSGVKLLISRCVFFLPDSGSPALSLHSHSLGTVSLWEQILN